MSRAMKDAEYAEAEQRRRTIAAIRGANGGRLPKGWMLLMSFKIGGVEVDCGMEAFATAYDPGDGSTATLYMAIDQLKLRLLEQ